MLKAVTEKHRRVTFLCNFESRNKSSLTRSTLGNLDVMTIVSYIGSNLKKAYCIIQLKHIHVPHFCSDTCI